MTGGHFVKIFVLSFVQLVARVVHPEVVQNGSPNKLTSESVKAFYIRLTENCCLVPRVLSCLELYIKLHHFL